MIEAVCRRGYDATSVAEVSALAGVSRRAFYESFSGKEDCFLATYDVVVARARKLVTDAWAGERSRGSRRHAALKALLDDVARSPKPPKLVLVEAPAVRASVRERIVLSEHSFDRIAGVAFRAAAEHRELPRFNHGAIIAGVRHLLALRLLERRESELAGLTDEVLDWWEAYDRTPPAVHRVLGEGTAHETVPVGFLSAGDERSRALRSIVQHTLDRGYRQLTDAQIAERAGISPQAFRRLFADRQECFLAALTEIEREALGRVQESAGDAACWAEAVCRGIDAFVDYAVSHAGLMRLAYRDVFEVGPAALDRMARPAQGLWELLAVGAPRPQRAAMIVADVVSGAVWGTVSSCILADRVARLDDLVGQLRFLVLAPYIGAGRAVEAIETYPRRAARA
jgi:AcrR family transcriptional regulator